MSDDSKRQSYLEVSNGQDRNLRLKIRHAENAVAHPMPCFVETGVVGNSCREDGLRSFAMKIIPIMFLTCCLMGEFCKSAVAEEPAQAFLDGLRERGYYDSALELSLIHI